jgi:hypothetical protein
VLHESETVSGTYKICIGTDGSVVDVVATESIPEADQTIIDHIRAHWRYEASPVKTAPTGEAPH